MPSLLVAVTALLLRNGAWWKTIEPQTRGPEVVRRKGIAQKRAAQSLQQSSAKSDKCPWLNNRRR